VGWRLPTVSVTSHLFAYGTLTNPAKFNEVSGGRSLETEKAELEGYAMDETGEFPIIRHDPEETILGLFTKMWMQKRWRVSCSCILPSNIHRVFFTCEEEV